MGVLVTNPSLRMMFNAKGQFIIRGQMAQLERGFRTHLNMGVLHEIVHAPDNILMEEKKKLVSSFSSVRLDKMFDRTDEWWACLQRLPNPIEQTEAWVNRDQERYGGESDMVLLPWRIPFYLTTVQPRWTTYSEVGPDGPANVKAGPDSMTTWGRHRVRMVKAFDVDRAVGALDFLLREVV